ncbi:SPOR domain-containing protein [Endothiovibrio diazotrophicus]
MKASPLVVEAPPAVEPAAAAPQAAAPEQVDDSPIVGYSVQVGSFGEQRYADESVDQWKVAGYPAFVYDTVSSNGRRWHTVRIGRYEAAEMTKRLRKYARRKGYRRLRYRWCSGDKRQDRGIKIARSTFPRIEESDTLGLGFGNVHSRFLEYDFIIDVDRNHRIVNLPRTLVGRESASELHYPAKQVVVVFHLQLLCLRQDLGIYLPSQIIVRRFCHYRKATYNHHQQYNNNFGIHNYIPPYHLPSTIGILIGRRPLPGISTTTPTQGSTFLPHRTRQ